jgi:hypothetical protein
MNRAESRPGPMMSMMSMKPMMPMKPMEALPLRALPLNSRLKKQARQPAASTNLRQ